MGVEWFLNVWMMFDWPEPPKRSIFTMVGQLCVPPTRKDQKRPQTVSRSPFSWSFGRLIFFGICGSIHTYKLLHTSTNPPIHTSACWALFRICMVFTVVSETYKLILGVKKLWPRKGHMYVWSGNPRKYHAKGGLRYKLILLFGRRQFRIDQLISMFVCLDVWSRCSKTLRFYEGRPKGKIFRLERSNHRHCLSILRLTAYSFGWGAGGRGRSP